MLVRDGVVICKVHLHVAPETQAKRLARLHGRQDDALARHRRGPLAGAQLWPGRARLRADPQGDRAPAGAVARRRRQRPAAPRARSRAAACSLRSATCRRPAAAAARAAGGLRVFAPRARSRCRRGCRAMRRPTTSTTRNSSGCRAGWRSLRDASASSVTPSWSPSRAWTRPARAVRSGASLRPSMPGSIRVVPVSAPTPDELAHPYLWRFWFHLPPRGNYTVFDRSWYGRVLVERVRRLAAPRRLAARLRRDQRVRAAAGGASRRASPSSGCR